MLQIEGAVQHLRETIVTKGADVDRSLKQYEMVKVMAQALSWQEMAPSLERALKHFFRVEAWAIYLTDEKGELQLAQRRGLVAGACASNISRTTNLFCNRLSSRLAPDQGKSVWVLHLPLWRLHERIGA